MTTHPNFETLSIIIALLGSAVVACGDVDAGVETTGGSLTVAATPRPSPVTEGRLPGLGTAQPVQTSAVYRDPNGNCQLGTNGADSNIVAGAERLACRAQCGSPVSDACAVEDGSGGCTVACNCDPLHKSCDDIAKGRGGGFEGGGGGPPIDQGAGL